MSAFGLSGMINIGAQLEHEFENLIVASIERPVEGTADYEMEIFGSRLAYRISLSPNGVTLSDALMDRPETGWDLLLRAADDSSGWDTVRRLAASLERNGVRSLQRPIESGEPGDQDCWVIA